MLVFICTQSQWSGWVFKFPLQAWWHLSAPLFWTQLSVSRTVLWRPMWDTWVTVFVLSALSPTKYTIQGPFVTQLIYTHVSDILDPYWFAESRKSSRKANPVKNTRNEKNETSHPYACLTTFKNKTLWCQSFTLCIMKS